LDGASVDKLREERKEEQRDLRVQDIGQKALRKDVAKDDGNV
jgi:hypothetical protein